MLRQAHEMNGESTTEVHAAAADEGGVAQASAAGDEVSAEVEQGPARDPRYPLTVLYCPISTLPAELHEYIPRNQFEKYVRTLVLRFR